MYFHYDVDVAAGGQSIVLRDDKGWGRCADGERKALSGPAPREMVLAALATARYLDNQKYARCNLSIY